MKTKKISPEEKITENIKQNVAYADVKEKIIGVYQTTEDMLFANKSKYVKKLKKDYQYHIQMVIK